MPPTERRQPVEVRYPNGVRTWDAEKNEGATFKVIGVHRKRHGDVVDVQYSARMTNEPDSWESWNWTTLN